MKWLQDLKRNTFCRMKNIALLRAEEAILVLRIVCGLWYRISHRCRGPSVCAVWDIPLVGQHLAHHGYLTKLK